MIDFITRDEELHKELPGLQGAIRSELWNRAARMEWEARQIARAFLPRRLGWLVDHPRLLGACYSLRLFKRPTVTIWR